MKTDQKEIARIAKSKENENWKFRSFLKGFDIEIEELDSIVHELFYYVASEIDCTKCANCCKEVGPLLKENDIKTLSDNIGMSIAEFKKQFLKKTDEGYFSFSRLPCPFLENNICTQYKSRPKDCRSYPHLHKKDFVFRLIGVIDNYSICPLVFNVYELLKERIWEDFIREKLTLRDCRVCRIYCVIRCSRYYNTTSLLIPTKTGFRFAQLVISGRLGN